MCQKGSIHLKRMGALVTMGGPLPPPSFTPAHDSWCILKGITHLPDNIVEVITGGRGFHVLDAVVVLYRWLHFCSYQSNIRLLIALSYEANCGWTYFLNCPHLSQILRFYANFYLLEAQLPSIGDNFITWVGVEGRGAYLYVAYRSC